MKRIAKFHKVSLEQFKKDWIDTFGLDEEANIEEIYENIKLPRRATAGSAARPRARSNACGPTT